jgi:hypothetical protein
MNTSYEELASSLRSLVDREQRRLDRKPQLTPNDLRLKEELAVLSHELNDPSDLDRLVEALDDALEELRQLQEEGSE